MKTLPAFLVAASFLAASEVQAQTKFDSVRYQHQKDSAWHELTNYDAYCWAFQWDSLYLVRWTSWTCDEINEREDERRARQDAYEKKRNEEDDAAFPEYSIIKRKDQKVISARH
jgi:hypothetical protein